MAAEPADAEMVFALTQGPDLGVAQAEVQLVAVVQLVCAAVPPNYDGAPDDLPDFDHPANLRIESDPVEMTDPSGSPVQLRGGNFCGFAWEVAEAGLYASGTDAQGVDWFAWWDTDAGDEDPLTIYVEDDYAVDGQRYQLTLHFDVLAEAGDLAERLEGEEGPVDLSRALGVDAWRTIAKGLDFDAQGELEDRR